MRKLLKKARITPATIVTDKLGSYGSALRGLPVFRGNTKPAQNRREQEISAQAAWLKRSGARWRR